jgi:hypothetical protein
MPYIKRKLKNGKYRVFKKVGGKLVKVGDTTASKVEAYLRKLRMVEHE